MTPIAVIQARTGSERLPDKVLRQLGPRPVLAWVIRAAGEAVGRERVVVATTRGEEDDRIERLCGDEGVRTVRGAKDDVLRRYIGAIEASPGDPVVRLTGDCPLLDPRVIADAVGAYAEGSFDYVSTVEPPTLPRGLDVEVFSAAVLRDLDARATGYDRVHVTSYIREHPDEFRMRTLRFAPVANDLRLTLDTPQDAALLDAVVAELGDRAPSWREAVALLRSRPDLVALNAGVRQKTFDEG